MLFLHARRAGEVVLEGTGRNMSWAVEMVGELARVMGMVMRRLLQGSLLEVDIMRVLGRIILCREGREYFR